MKNNFNILNEEKSRIISLHETATKRYYLSEQYDPTTQVMVVGSGTQPSVIFDKKTKKALRLADIVNDVKVRLDTTNPQNRSDGETFAKDPVVNCQFNKIASTNTMIPESEIQKCLAVKTNITKSSADNTNTKKNTQPNPKVIQIQEKLKTMGFASLLGKSGAKGDGVDGFLGQNTINAILQALSKTENVNPEQLGQTQMKLSVNQQEPELKK